MDDPAYSKTAAHRLWEYVRANEAILASASFSSRSAAFADCDALVRAIHQDIDWEVGPLGDGTFFALGPNGSRALLEVCREACGLGPELLTMTKLAGRPKRRWSRRIVVLKRASGDVEVDFEQWRFSIDVRHGRPAILCFPGELDPRAVRAWEMLCRQMLNAELGEAAVLELGIEPVFVEAGASTAPAHAVPPRDLPSLVARLIAQQQA
jgi:hypothetical protein